MSCLESPSDQDGGSPWAHLLTSPAFKRRAPFRVSKNKRAVKDHQASREKQTLMHTEKGI